MAAAACAGSESMQERLVSSGATGENGAAVTIGLPADRAHASYTDQTLVGGQEPSAPPPRRVAELPPPEPEPEMPVDVPALAAVPPPEVAEAPLPETQPAPAESEAPAAALPPAPADAAPAEPAFTSEPAESTYATAVEPAPSSDSPDALIAGAPPPFAVPSEPAPVDEVPAPDRMAVREEPLDEPAAYSPPPEPADQPAAWPPLPQSPEQPAAWTPLPQPVEQPTTWPPLPAPAGTAPEPANQQTAPATAGWVPYEPPPVPMPSQNQVAAGWMAPAPATSVAPATRMDARQRLSPTMPVPVPPAITGLSPAGGPQPVPPAVGTPTASMPAAPATASMPYSSQGTYAPQPQAVYPPQPQAAYSPPGPVYAQPQTAYPQPPMPAPGWAAAPSPGYASAAPGGPGSAPSAEAWPTAAWPAEQAAAMMPPPATSAGAAPWAAPETQNVGVTTPSVEASGSPEDVLAQTFARQLQASGATTLTAARVDDVAPAGGGWPPAHGNATAPTPLPAAPPTTPYEGNGRVSQAPDYMTPSAAYVAEPGLPNPAAELEPAMGIAPSPSVEPAVVIRFAHGSGRLDAGDRALLRELASIYRQRGGRLRIIGHASGRTANMSVQENRLSNFAMSLRRAGAVADVLRGYGVSGEEMIIEAVGDSRPIYHESTPVGELGNRRVEIYFE